MSRQLQQKAAELAKWYDYHHRQPESVPMRLKFQEDVSRELFRLVMQLVDDIQRIEGRDEVKFQAAIDDSMRGYRHDA